MKILLLLALLASPAAAQNLLTNPGFEDGLSGWSVWRYGQGGVRADAVAHDGSGSALLSVVRVGDVAQVAQAVRVVPGRRYCLEGWLQALGPHGGGFHVTVHSGAWGAAPTVELSAGGAAWEWTWQRICWHAPGRLAVLTVSAVVGLSGGGGYVDSLALVAQ